MDTGKVRWKKLRESMDEAKKRVNGSRRNEIRVRKAHAY